MRVRRLGCGLELPMRSVTADRLEQSMRELLRRRASGAWECERIASQLSSGPEVLRRAAQWVIRRGRRKAAGNPCFNDGG
jgi:UDP:flavonoid glycosyltransferase YjiC (YdhE family)